MLSNFMQRLLIEVYPKLTSAGKMQIDLFLDAKGHASTVWADLVRHHYTHSMSSGSNFDKLEIEDCSDHFTENGKSPEKHVETSALEGAKSPM